LKKTSQFKNGYQTYTTTLSQFNSPYNNTRETNIWERAQNQMTTSHSTNLTSIS